MSQIQNPSYHHEIDSDATTKSLNCKLTPAPPSFWSSSSNRNNSNKNSEGEGPWAINRRDLYRKKDLGNSKPLDLCLTGPRLPGFRLAAPYEVRGISWPEGNSMSLGAQRFVSFPCWGIGLFSVWVTWLSSGAKLCFFLWFFFFF